MANRIIYETKKGVLTITLNRPEKHNCMDWEMLQGLSMGIAEAENNSDIKIVVIQGAGEKAFSSGADLKLFSTLNDEDAKKWVLEGNKLFNRIEDLSQPTIAVLKGYVIGGGSELALACDFRIGTTSTMFSFPEVISGWLPGWGGMARLKRLTGEAFSKKLILLGEKIYAEEAYQFGLLTKKVQPEELEEALEEYFIKLKKLKPTVYNLAKKAIRDENRLTTGSDLLYDVLALKVMGEN